MRPPSRASPPAPIAPSSAKSGESGESGLRKLLFAAGALGGDANRLE